LVLSYGQHQAFLQRVARLRPMSVLSQNTKNST
jgi:hypothetical protein